MYAYLVSLLAGILIGVIYHLLGVRSPAPPIIALIGLLGILIGENGFPAVKDHFFSSQKQPQVTENEHHER